MYPPLSEDTEEYWKFLGVDGSKRVCLKHKNGKMTKWPDGATLLVGA